MTKITFEKNTTFSVDVFADDVLIGIIRMSGGWFVGTYFDANGLGHGIDVHAEPIDALRAIVRSALPDEVAAIEAQN